MCPPHAAKGKFLGIFKSRMSRPDGVAQLVGSHSQSERSPVQFPVRAHARVAFSVPGQGSCKRQAIDVSLSHQCFSPSLSPSLPLSLKEK